MQVVHVHYAAVSLALPAAPYCPLMLPTTSAFPLSFSGWTCTKHQTKTGAYPVHEFIYLLEVRLNACASHTGRGLQCTLDLSMQLPPAEATTSDDAAALTSGLRLRFWRRRCRGQSR